MDTILIAQYNSFGRKCRREDTDRLLLQSVDEFLKSGFSASERSPDHGECSCGTIQEIESWQKELQIQRTEIGKPYVVGGRTEKSLPFVSVAHTGSHWFGAVANYPVGIDVEIVKPLDFEKLAARFYTYSEKEYCAREGLAGFFRIWCRKEALVKIKGSTLGKGLSGFETVTGGAPAENLQIEGTSFYLQDYCPRKGLVGCIVSEKKSRLYHVEIM